MTASAQYGRISRPIGGPPPRVHPDSLIRVSKDGEVNPTVVAIHIAPATRLPMKAVDSVEAEAGVGLVGDRYHGAKHRHVTVQSATELAEAAVIHEAPIEYGATRRNITISHGAVPTKPGDRLTVGPVLLEVVRIAAPCRLLDDVIGDGARVALRRRAGTVCRLLSSGPIVIGDPVDLAVEPDQDDEAGR